MNLNKFTLAVAFLFLICSCSSENINTDDSPTPPPDGVANDDEVSDPIVLPEVRTLDIGELLISYVEFNGQLISNGDSPISEIGFVVGTEEGATIDSNFSRHPIPDEISDDFSLTVYDIPAETDFYLRAYAINTNGVGYGDDVAFKTLEDKVFEGNVRLETQEQVEAFGAMDITTIEGNLTITGTANNLAPLATLERVSSAVEIFLTSELKTLEGLNNLTHTGYLNFSPFRIFSNSGLESLQGLNGLVNADGGLIIGNMDLLVDLNGLESLIKIEGRSTFSLSISNCNNLTSLNGLENLESVQNLEIIVCPLLSDISALSNLISIENSLFISQCHSLADLEGLQGITQLEELNISDNDRLTSLSGLGNMEEVPVIVVLDNETLADITALGGLTAAESLVFSRNEALLDFTGLERITFVSILSVENNSNLQSFAGLGNLEEVNVLDVIRNDALQNLNGLEGLKRITNNASQSRLGISTNPSLISLDGLENLTLIEEDLSITNNTNLSDFCALGGLLGVNGLGGEMVIQDNLFNPTSEEISSGNCSQ